MSYRIPIYQPDLSGNEKKYLIECVDSTWISGKGRFVDEFERSFAKYINIRYASAACNGTVALHLALAALGLKEGDEVIVPSFTYIASVNSITYTGASPVFADSLKNTWQLDPEDVKKKITSKTKAIMLVHLYGYPCDVTKFIKIAKENNLFLIEDCAESFGSKFGGRDTGTFGDIAAFSFFGNKTITTGEGGMVVTNDKTLSEKVEHLKGQGLAKFREYWHDIVGFNYRMTNMCAAIGLAQLERADELIAAKVKVTSCYNKYLKNIPVELFLPQKNVKHNFWMYSILTKDAEEREGLRDFLKKSGIETRPTFYPVHTMPMYAIQSQKLPVAENLGWRGVCLPSYPALKETEIKEICKCIENFYGEFNK